MQEANDVKASTLLDTLNILSFVWKMISAETIRNCFRYAGLVKKSISSIERTGIQKMRLPQGIAIQRNVEFNLFTNYVNVDDNVRTVQELTNPEITEKNHSIGNEEEENEEKKQPEQVEVR